MLVKLVEKLSNEIQKSDNIELVECKIINPMMTHIYNRLKKYIFRVLLMYYLIIILLLVIIAFLILKRK
jgi:hypothetical protein